LLLHVNKKFLPNYFTYLLKPPTFNFLNPFYYLKCQLKFVTFIQVIYVKEELEKFHVKQIFQKQIKILLLLECYYVKHIIIS